MIPLPAKEESILPEQAKLSVHQNDWAAGFLDVTGLTFPAHAVHCLGVTSYRWLNAHRRRKDSYGSAIFHDYREMPC